MLTCITDKHIIKVSETIQNSLHNYIIYANDTEVNQSTNIKNTCQVLVDFIKNNINNELIDISNELTFYGVECYATSKYVGYLCKLSKKYLVLPELTTNDIYRILIQV